MYILCVTMTCIAYLNVVKIIRLVNASFVPPPVPTHAHVTVFLTPTIIFARHPHAWITT